MHKTFFMDENKIHSIIMICTANMCRSPIAEALLSRKLQERFDTARWRVESAGTWTVEGRKAAAQVVEVMRRIYGIDLSEHRTRSVSRSLLQPFDLILVMESGHKEAIRVEFPEVAPRVYLLYEMVGQVRDVDDPIGGELTDFEDTVRELDGLITEGFEDIIQLVRGEKPGEME